MGRRPHQPSRQARKQGRVSRHWAEISSALALSALAIGLASSCTFDLQEPLDPRAGSGGSGALGGGSTTGGSGTTTSDTGTTSTPTGSCSPGQTSDLGECGDCGSSISVCDASGQWGPPSCEGEGICTPNAESYEDCGDCGTATSICTDACDWGPPGACTGEGVCAEGTTRPSDCDQCSEQTCTAGCTWSTCELKPDSECEYEAGEHWEYCQPGYWRFCSFACQWYPCAPIP